MKNYMPTNFDNPEEMDEFPDSYNLQKLNEEEIENLHEPITSKESEKVIENLLKNKSLGPDGFSGEFYQTLKKDLVPILLKLFQKIEEDRTLPNTFYKTTITLIPKPNKNNTKKENYRPI